jgi:hypothetical protein
VALTGRRTPKIDTTSAPERSGVEIARKPRNPRHTPKTDARCVRFLRVPGPGHSRPGAAPPFPPLTLPAPKQRHQAQRTEGLSALIHKFAGGLVASARACGPLGIQPRRFGPRPESSGCLEPPVQRRYLGSCYPP